MGEARKMIDHVLVQTAFSHLNQCGAIRTEEEEAEFKEKTNLILVKLYAATPDNNKKVLRMLGDFGVTEMKKYISKNIKVNFK